MSKVTQLGKVELRHEPRQAVCPESRPHHHADGFFLPPAWARHTFGLGLRGRLMTQRVGRPQSLGIHASEGAKKHPGKGGASNKNSTTLNILPRYA